MQRLEAETYLDGIASRLREHGVNAVAVVAEGRAADEIVRQVREQGVDLVVASAFGQGGVCEFPEGGTVREVLSLAPSSAMLVRPATEPRAPGTAAPEAAVTYRRILAPVDGSAVAEWALLLAAGLARAQGAELILLHVDAGVAPAWGLMPATAEETELAERLAKLRRRRGRAYLGRMRDRLASSDLRVRSRLVTAARVEQGILAVAAEEEADLIAVGAHGREAAPEACGATTQRLLAASPVPVLAFQDRRDHARPDRP
jgi:nucleotide-binding universal stress UspA family protein